jgi:hypothetical protein
MSSTLSDTKLCACGCGELVLFAWKKNQFTLGRIKGQHPRFLHGHARRDANAVGRTPEYRAYMEAKLRCTNPNNHAWQDYGGRGIKFLFTSFEQFFAELGKRPAGVDSRGRALYSLDRKDNDGNYEPGNVRWATRDVQQNNRRTTCHS